MKNIAVILAGGSGIRFGEETPKQFTKVAGKKIIEHTIDAFETNKLIDEIFIVINKEYSYLLTEICTKNNYSKLKKILYGGSERYKSSLVAIEACEKECNLLFHDAVRPLVSQKIINDCILALDKYNAIDVAVKTSDTIINCFESKITSIPDRTTLYNGQTPQCFKLSTIKNAYIKALSDPNFKTTDDCGVVKQYLPTEQIYVVQGEQSNIKLTYKEDLFLIDKLFQLKTCNSKTFENINKEFIEKKVVVIFGGSSGIGLDIQKILQENGATVISYSRSTGVNIANPNDVKLSLENVNNKFGKIDVVINTAAILQKQTLVSMTDDEVNQGILTNYLGTINIAKYSYDYLKETQGSLLLFTSSSYTKGRALYSIYSSTKAAIVNLTQALCEEWDSTGIRINCICPARTHTPMRTSNFGNEDLSTLLKSEDVAKVSIQTCFSELNGEVVDVHL